MCSFGLLMMLTRGRWLGGGGLCCCMCYLEWWDPREWGCVVGLWGCSGGLGDRKGLLGGIRACVCLQGVRKGEVESGCFGWMLLGGFRIH